MKHSRKLVGHSLLQERSPRPKFEIFELLGFLGFRYIHYYDIRTNVGSQSIADMHS